MFTQIILLVNYHPYHLANYLNLVTLDLYSVIIQHIPSPPETTHCHCLLTSCLNKLTT